MREETKVRFEMIFDIIKELFNTSEHYATFDGNKVTIKNRRETMILTSFYDKISLEPRGMVIFNQLTDEIELTLAEEDYINFSLKLYLESKHK